MSAKIPVTSMCLFANMCYKSSMRLKTSKYCYTNCIYQFIIYNFQYADKDLNYDNRVITHVHVVMACRL